MTYPMSEEIFRVHQDIERDGPCAHVTMELCALVLRDPHLRAIVNRLMGALPPSEFRAPGEALLASAIATGLNYGLRIHERRIAPTEALP
jgi:hypothetical protein